MSRDGVFIEGKVEGIRRKEKEKRKGKFVGRYDGRKVGGCHGINCAKWDSFVMNV